MGHFDGYLFAKLHLIGTKSEGSKYFLQQFDYFELEVVKQTPPWKDDPALHAHLNTRVSIEGEWSPEGIRCRRVVPYKPLASPEAETKLELQLAITPNPLWIPMMPSRPHSPAALEFVLRVRWKPRSIWSGACPTSQIYDFWIEREGNEIWRWSQGKYFSNVITSVRIPGGNKFHEFAEVGRFSADDVPGEGSYVAKAIFIASGQEAEAELEIKFAR